MKLPQNLTRQLGEQIGDFTKVVRDHSWVWEELSKYFRAELEVMYEKEEEAAAPDLQYVSPVCIGERKRIRSTIRLLEEFKSAKDRKQASKGKVRGFKEGTSDPA